MASVYLATDCVIQIDSGLIYRGPALVREAAS